MSSSNCCFLTCIQISQEADQVVWYSHLLKNFPRFIVICTVKDFGIVNKASNLSCLLPHSNQTFAPRVPKERASPLPFSFIPLVQALTFEFVCKMVLYCIFHSLLTIFYSWGMKVLARNREKCLARRPHTAPRCHRKYLMYEPIKKIMRTPTFRFLSYPCMKKIHIWNCEVRFDINTLPCIK